MKYICFVHEAKNTDALAHVQCRTGGLAAKVTCDTAATLLEKLPLQVPSLPLAGSDVFVWDDTPTPGWRSLQTADIIPLHLPPGPVLHIAYIAPPADAEETEWSFIFKGWRASFKVNPRKDDTRVDQDDHMKRKTD